MWKTGKQADAMRLFSPQPDVEESELFNRPWGENFFGKCSTENVSTFHSPCGEILTRKITPVSGR